MNILRFLREQAKDYDCTVCGTNHARSEIRVLGKLESAWVVRVTCTKCSTQVKLLVVVDGSERSAVPFKRDHPSEIRRRPSLTEDEVIDAHEFLRTYGGNVDALFGAPAGKADHEKDGGTDR